ncbi:hypothetical protein QVD17_11990 [Tagetes erecta]|uniref:Uncharacterized protein n=1 Tax=Tagetes erecta TaxID=13708 RepID=A0AAD8KV94_TARER|nr:hypothetical protein QVD17_11990 [Tagetes erecta]
MRDIANNVEDIEVIYHPISHGEIVNPADLVDEVPDNQLDDDEYFARHPEDENEGEDESESDDIDDDSGNDGDDGNDSNMEESAESIHEEAENVEVDESTEIETENVETIEPMMTDEPIEVEKAVEEIAVEVPKEITVQYAECNALRAEKEVLEKWIKEEEAVSSESDKDFTVDEDVGVSETPRDVAVYQTRSQRSKTVTEPIVESVPIPDEAVAAVNFDKAEGKRKLDAVPEITREEVVVKKARIEETVQIEPIQSESVTEVEVSEVAKVDEAVKEIETDKTVQIEPIQSESVLIAEVPEVVELVENVQETVTEEEF